MDINTEIFDLSKIKARQFFFALNFDYLGENYPQIREYVSKLLVAIDLYDADEYTNFNDPRLRKIATEIMGLEVIIFNDIPVFDRLLIYYQRCKDTNRSEVVLNVLSNLIIHWKILMDKIEDTPDVINERIEALKITLDSITEYQKSNEKMLDWVDNFVAEWAKYTGEDRYKGKTNEPEKAVIEEPQGEELSIEEQRKILQDDIDLFKMLQETTDDESEKSALQDDIDLFEMLLESLPKAKYGRRFNKGGSVGYENKAMVMSDNKTIKHHTGELENALKSKKSVPAWVVAKTHKASGDLSDITHYLENSEEYAKGGKVGDFYIEYLNKNKNFQKDIIYFDTYEKAREWAMKNFDRFDPDVIRVKYAEGGEIFKKENYEVGDRIRYIDTFRREEKDGTIYQINEQGTYIVDTGLGIRGVDKNEVVGAYPKAEPKKKRFGLFNQGGNIEKNYNLFNEEDKFVLNGSEQDIIDEANTIFYYEAQDNDAEEFTTFDEAIEAFESMGYSVEKI